MNDFDDPLDLLDDDGDGVIEVSLIEEEEKLGNKKSSGCSVVLFLIASLLSITRWLVT